jgi:2EXR family protein
MFFHSFTRLPSEIRSRIWDIAACEPRLVVVSDFKGKADDPTMEPTSFTPPPAILHVSRESRSAGLKRYTKMLDDGVRYAWVNMTIDTVKMYVCAMSGFLDLDELKHISIVLHKTHGGSFLMDTGFYTFSRLETLEMTYPTVEAELIDTLLDSWSEEYPDVVVKRKQIPTGNEITKHTPKSSRDWWSKTGVRCILPWENV